MAIPANNAVMSLSKDATMRSVGDGAVLLMVKSGQLYSCNETARDFIGRLDGVRDFEVLVKEISLEYEVTPQTLTEDLSELLEYLLNEGVLISMS